MYIYIYICTYEKGELGPAPSYSKYSQHTCVSTPLPADPSPPQKGFAAQQPTEWPSSIFVSVVMFIVLSFAFVTRVIASTPAFPRLCQQILLLFQKASQLSNRANGRVLYSYP